MKKGEKDSASAGLLRRRAEELLRQGRKREVDHPGTADAAQGLVHELQVHQIELEMQNEELMQSRAKMEESLDRYSELYDFSPAGYFTLDADGKILQVNLTGTRMLGTERSQLVNRRFGLFVSESDRPAFNAFLTNAFERRAKESCELALPNVLGPLPSSQLSGSRRMVQIEGTVGEEGQDCRAVMIDITDRKMLEDAHLFLVQSGWSGEDFFQSLARYLAEALKMDFVCIDCLEGDCLSAQTLAIYHNGRFEDNLAYALKDTPCGDVVGKTICGFPKGVRHLFPKDKVLQELMAESYLGTTLWSSDGKPIGLIAIISSQTKTNLRLAESILKMAAIRAAGELERRQAGEALKKAKDALEDRVAERTAEVERRALQLRQLTAELTLAEQRERQRISLVLHDGLQQILVAAKFQIALLEKTKDVPKTTAELVELIDDGIETSRSLTAELSPPILQQGGLVPALEWLGKWMRDKHGLTVGLASHGNIESAPEEVRILMFHSTRELLFNVVKHAGVKTARVEIVQEDSRIRVDVEDEGVGFDPIQLKREGTESRGLGLFSIQERLSYLGGSMEIDSAPGRGSRFTLITPPISMKTAISPIDQRLIVSISVASRREAAVGSEKRVRVVLVDDHMVMRQGLAGLLRAEPDIEIAGEASDGQSAIDLIRELRPDVVLMDISMPGMDGIQATRIIHKELPEVRIIGLSMFQEGEQQAAMREVGAVDYLTKTGPADALVEAIRACVRVSEKSFAAESAKATIQ
jgi:PAS domain S-box-containing protein